MKRNYTVLYVDDDSDDLSLVSDAFKNHTDHLAVVHADNGSEGLKTLAKMNDEGSLPCLVIIDINMPIMSGKQMLEKLREQTEFKDIPVILFSTSNAQIDKQFAEKYDAEFISKPSNYAELQFLVRELAGRCGFEV